MFPTIEWHGRYVRMIDQRKLPGKTEWHICRTCADVVKSIEDMVIRGAPAIGIAAAMGLALGAGSVKKNAGFQKRFGKMCSRMLKARPTAVNLRWAVERMSLVAERVADMPHEDIRKALREESERMLLEDIEVNKKIGQHGQGVIPARATILTHCNAGALATGGYGTALGVVRAARESGKEVRVIADETRPWLQGLRLTAFELMADGIDVTVIADSAAGYMMRQKKVDLVITGADRIAANGDVANKIGTYSLAVLARENGIPFYVAAPLSTIDLTVRSGEEIPVEERLGSEIVASGKRLLGPKGVKAFNPVFDITPSRYVTAIITENGLLRAPYRAEIKRTKS